MATFRIKLPGQDEARVVPLRGDHITIGRRPDNTVQIPEPTLSGRHAELVRDNGRYRLRDLGSLNGTFVEGEPVTDFHLHGRCKISFGTFECEFDPNAEVPVPRTPSPHSELETAQKENEELRTQIESIQAKLGVLRIGHAPKEEARAGISHEEFEHVIAEREATAKRLESVEAQLADARAEAAARAASDDREKLATDHAALRDELAMSRQVMNGLREEATRSVPRAAFEQVAAERTALSELLQRAEERVEGLRAELSGAVPKEKVDQMVAERTALVDRLQAAETQIASLQQSNGNVPTLEKMAAERTSMEDGMKAAKLELAAAREEASQRLEVTEAQLSALRAEAARSVPKMNFEEVSAECESLRERLKASELQVTELRKEAARGVTRQEFDALSSARATLDAQLTENQSALAQLREELALLRREREEFRADSTAARQELDRLRGLLRDGASANDASNPSRASGPLEPEAGPLKPLRPIAVPRSTKHNVESAHGSESNGGDVSELRKLRVPEIQGLGVNRA